MLRLLDGEFEVATYHLVELEKKNVSKCKNVVSAKRENERRAGEVVVNSNRSVCRVVDLGRSIDGRAGDAVRAPLIIGR